MGVGIVTSMFETRFSETGLLVGVAKIVGVGENTGSVGWTEAVGIRIGFNKFFE